MRTMRCPFTSGAGDDYCSWKVGRMVTLGDWGESPGRGDVVYCGYD
jgi:hypothetical protein